MNELQVFKNEEFGKVRTITVDNEPWFVGKDVAEILQYQNGSRDVTLHVDERDRLKYKICTAGQMREQILINESGLYSLILGSKLPKAKEFKHWVTSEVLPSIRKHGGYIAGQESMSDDELVDRALLVVQRRIEERNKVIAAQNQIIRELTSKAEYVDVILNNKGTLTITQIAKDYGMSGKQMNRILADLRIQYKQSGQWLLYSAHQSKGWTHSDTIPITRHGGKSDIVMETKWTQKGRLALYELLKKEGILPMIEKN